MTDRVAAFITNQLVRVPTATALDEVRQMRRDHRGRVSGELLPPMPAVISAQLQGRLEHEAGHAFSAMDSGNENIEVVIRPDGTGWCSYTLIDKNPIHEIRTNLVGVIAEARYYPPALNRYSDGCSDFLAARLLIDEYNSCGRCPPMTCEAATRLAVEFVDRHWQAIGDLALVLGNSGTLCDSDIRLFATCRQ